MSKATKHTLVGGGTIQSALPAAIDAAAPDEEAAKKEGNANWTPPSDIAVDGNNFSKAIDDDVKEHVNKQD